MTIDPTNQAPDEIQRWLQSAVVPRPIGLVSTIDRDGHPNLSPFSFFNLFSGNPPVVIFSPARRVRDNTRKNTLENLYEIPEVVIHIINEEILPQAILASADYPKGINEFLKAGFTAMPAKKVRPPMVRECPVKLEGKVKEIKPLGNYGGAGNLIIAEIVLIHISEKIIAPGQNEIEPWLLNPVARLGGEWYSRVNASSIFKMEKPGREIPIGIDALPASVRRSRVLQGKHLARLAGVVQLPTYAGSIEFISQLARDEEDPLAMRTAAHELARIYIESDKIAEAWQVLLAEMHYYENSL